MKNTNKILIFLLIGACSLGGIFPALAAEDITSLPVVPTVLTVAPGAETPDKQIDKETNLKRLIKRGDNLINARVNTLNALKNRVVAKGNKLTDTQKIDLNTLIDGNINGLKELKAKIDAGTDIAVVKDLIKSIYTNYRIYAVFVPKVHLIIALDRLQNHLDGLDAVYVKIQENIDKLKAKGKDVAKRQTALESAKTMKTEIQTKITAALEAAKALKPADYPDTHKQKISEIRLKIKEITQLFNKQRVAARAK